MVEGPTLSSAGRAKRVKVGRDVVAPSSDRLPERLYIPNLLGRIGDKSMTGLCRVETGICVGGSAPGDEKEFSGESTICRSARIQFGYS